MDGAQSIVSIQGPWLVHDASKAIKLTHWRACTGLGCSWHIQSHLHATIHRALAHIQSTSQGICCLHARSSS